MKFTVLLPTRNRLELLKYAIESVRRQSYPDWEIVISDNASEEDIGTYVTMLDDSRIRYFRTASFLPVTENWNNALRHASGDFIVMLGDDDALMPEYFSILAAYIDKYSPDVIYTDAYQFAYPNVIPGHPSGFIQRGYTEFLVGRENDDPFWIDKAEALELVRKSMSFRIAFGFNMQHYLVSRKIIADVSIAGEFYQSPYPDYYASNVLLLESRGILVVPLPLVVIGISPKSFGYYYFNNKESDGDAFLLNSFSVPPRSSMGRIILPGSSLYTSWLYAMQAVKSKFDHSNCLRIDYSRYRFLQISSLMGKRDWSRLIQSIPKLSFIEAIEYILFYGLLGFIMIFRLGRLFPRLRKRLVDFMRIAPEFDLRIRSVTYNNILEMIENEGKH